MQFIKETANSDFDEEAVRVLTQIVDGWTADITVTFAPEEEKIRGAIYQGGILGLNIAARMLRQRFRAATAKKGDA